jgi:amino acid adenylation domain-containing protein
MDSEGTREQLFPLSFAQQRLWFLNELDPGAAYNIPRVIRIAGTLDVIALDGAVQALVARHEGLRSAFASIDGEPWQSVLPSMRVDLPVVDLRHLPHDEREQAAFRMAGEEATRPFDLNSSSPLLRMTLLHLEDEEHILILVMHHIITDGWSMGIFFRELAELYEARVDGRAPELPELTIQSSDLVQWQSENISGELLKEQIEYWKKKLQGAELILALPTDHPRPAVHSGRGGSESFFLEKEIADKLKSMSQSGGSTLFMTLLAVFQILLWRYTLQETILVGIPVAGRNAAELETLIGFFVNTLILRADLSDDLTVREFLKQVRSTALEAYAHQDIPFERLVQELKPERTLSHAPFFQVMFIFQNAPRQKLELQGLVLEELRFESGTAKFDLTLEVIELDGLHCAFEYNSDLFERASINRMIGYFKTLINAFIQSPDVRISSLQLLSEQERRQILVEWNHTAADYPKDVCIQAAFDEQGARTPDAVAFLHNGNQLTYRQLSERANRLANYLIDQGVKPGALVGISIERSLEMAVGLLGILKAGAVYVPLDPSEPKQRLALMLEDSKVETVVTAHDFRDRLPERALRLLSLDAEKAAIDAQSAKNPCVSRSAGDLAYVIYTSGSTGTPKGVEGTHRAAMNRFSWMWKTYPFRAGETCCQKTALSFIDSVWEIFGPLLRGIRNVIIPAQVLLDPEQFVRWLAEYEVSRIVLVPSLLRMLLDHVSNLAEKLPHLRLWSASGEVLTRDIAQRFLAALPHATLLNIYGSSEVAADVTCHEVTERDLAFSVPIGRPIDNTEIYVLDRQLSPVPIGVHGEIHVGGVCLARGYWNRPETTAERFVASPFEQSTSTRLYKTGDLGRYLPNGAIEYIGRVDNQVKVRGFRVELGEIEAALRAHPVVREVAVIVQGEQQNLVAYLVTSNGTAPLAAELRRFVRSRLPEHMVPSGYVALESLPKLPSGKQDRKALLAVNTLRPASERTYVAPRTEVEKGLASIWREVYCRSTGSESRTTSSNSEDIRCSPFR